MRENERFHFPSVSEELDYLREHPDFFLENYQLRSSMPKPQKYAMYGLLLLAF